MRTVQFGDVEVTRFVIGGNPFSGFSHQGPQRDKEMVRYYTVARIKEALRKAEAAGIMVNHGMSPVARPILDELLALIDQHQLEAWEPADVVSKPLGLLIRCLDAKDAPLRQKLYPRLAKLDPLMAMQVGQAPGAAGAAQPQTQGASSAPSAHGTPPPNGNPPGPNG